MPTPRPLPTTPSLPASFWWMTMALIVLPQLAVLAELGLNTTARAKWLWPTYTIVVLTGIGGCWLVYRRDRRRLEGELRTHLLCPRCRYVLDNPGGPAFDVCPECGTDADPERVRRVWKAWLVSEEE